MSSDIIKSGDVPDRESRSYVMIRRVTLTGSALNICLALTKIIAGKLTGSIALIADGAHSFGDLISDVAVLAGVRIASKPCDESHQYGHGKFETLAGIFVAFLLVGTGGGIAWSAINALINDVQSYTGETVIIVAAVSIAAKEWLYWITRSVGKKVRSPAVIANAWHHRSDALSSVAVLLGGVGSLLGWGHADQVAAVVVAVMIVLVGLDMSWKGIDELLEVSIEPKFVESIRELIQSHPQVRNFHALRTRKVGNEIFVDVHILVDPDLSVAQGHMITQDLEKGLETRLSNPVNFLIHVEPDVPELRK
jgi:cation diffusion facilitator family transporter